MQVGGLGGLPDESPDLKGENSQDLGNPGAGRGVSQHESPEAGRASHGREDTEGSAACGQEGTGEGRGAVLGAHSDPTCRLQEGARVWF